MANFGNFSTAFKDMKKLDDESEEEIEFIAEEQPPVVDIDPVETPGSPLNPRELHGQATPHAANQSSSNTSPKVLTPVSLYLFGHRTLCS